MQRGISVRSEQFERSLPCDRRLDADALAERLVVFDGTESELGVRETVSR